MNAGRQNPSEADIQYSPDFPTPIWYYLDNPSHAGTNDCTRSNGIDALFRTESVHSFLRNRCTLSAECAGRRRNEFVVLCARRWRLGIRVRRATPSLNLGVDFVTPGWHNGNTDKLLWQSRLPAGGYATPCTYMVQGRQYVVIAAGGGGKLGTKSGDSFVAFEVR